MTSRQPFREMSVDEMRAWVQSTREGLRLKMQRERAYLDYRVAHGIHTPTDDRNEADLLLETDLLALLDELEQGL